MDEFEVLYNKLEKLRYQIWLEDIPHPTVPEYREHHESIKRILARLDDLIEEEFGSSKEELR